MRMCLVAGLAAAVVAGGASAATLDLTDRAIWSSGASSQTVLGSTVTVSSVGGAISFDENFDGPASSAFCAASSGPLACISDGLGVNDDEISRASRAVESVTVSFSQPLRVTGFHFLDLFFHPAGGTESAQVFINGAALPTFSFDAALPRGVGGGYLFAAIAQTPVTSIRFVPGLGNDGDGVGDFALAGIDVAPIPLPAAAWMLLSGLGALGAARLRRRAA